MRKKPGEEVTSRSNGRGSWRDEATVERSEHPVFRAIDVTKEGIPDGSLRVRRRTAQQTAASSAPLRGK